MTVLHPIFMPLLHSIIYFPLNTGESHFFSYQRLGRQHLLTLQLPGEPGGLHQVDSERESSLLLLSFSDQHVSFIFSPSHLS